MRGRVKILKYIIFWVFFCELIFINGGSIFILNGWGIQEADNEKNEKVSRYIAGINVDHVEISSDGQYFVAEGGCMLYFFNKSSQIPLWNYTSGGPGNNIRSVSISSDGQYIVTASDTRWTCLFEKDNSTPLWHHFESSFQPYSVAISSNGQYIVAGTGSGSGAEGSVRYGKVCFFNKTSPIPLWNYSIEEWITCVAISSNGKYIAAGGRDKIVYFFENTNSTPLWTYETGNSIESVAISSDGQYIIAGSDDNNIYLFSNTNNTPIWTYSTGSAYYSLAISSNGSYIIVGGLWDGSIYLFNNTSNIPLWKYSRGDLRKTVAMSSDGQYIAVGRGDGKVSLFGITSKSPLWTYRVGEDLRMMSISANGKYVVAQIENIIYLIPTTYKPPPDYSFVGIILFSIIGISILALFLYSLFYIIDKRVVNA